MQRPQSVSTRYFFAFQTLLAAAMVLGFFVLKQPVAKITADPGESLEEKKPAPASWSILRLPPVLRTNAVVEVKVGPDEDYEVVGLLPRNGRLDVVGRDESGEWLAVTFMRGSKLYGWIPTTSVSGVINLNRLEIVPVSLKQAD